MKLITKGALSLIAATSVAFAGVVATVNGENITTDEINIMLSQNRLPKFETLDEANQKKIVESMIDRKIIYSHAKSQNIEKSDKYKQIAKTLQENVAIDLWVESYIKSLPATDMEARKLYDEHIDRFKQPEQARARHILVDEENEAKEIIKTLNGTKESGVETKFEELAVEKSKDPGSGAKGGDLGYFPREQMVKEFSDATFDLKVGKYTKKPVKSPFGYHIIYLVDKKAANTIEFSKVAEQLKDEVRMQKFETNMEKLTEDLKKKAKITRTTK